MSALTAILTAIFQRATDWARRPEDRGFDTYQPKTMKHLVAICVGHSRIGDRGAVSAGGVSEHSYNAELAKMVKAELDALNVPSFIVDFYEGGSYGGAMRWLADHIERKHASLAIEQHFNASDGSGNGHEWLHWSSSVKSSMLAESLDKAFTAAFPEIKRRGVKPKKPGDRGALFLSETHCPAVIAEPFFGDNPDDWRVATERKGDIAKAIAAGIREYLSP